MKSTAFVANSLVLLFSLLFFAAKAQNIDPAAKQLLDLEKTLEQSQTERKRITNQAGKVERDLASVRQDMISTAEDIQNQEYSLTILENRIDNLEAKAKDLTEVLGRRDAQMGQVLLALERLALRPGDALTLHPLAPDDAVRSAILLRAAVPHIKHSAAELQTQLSGLYQIRRQIINQKDHVAVASENLQHKRNQLNDLIREKERQQAALATQRTAIDRRVAEIAREAQDLRELFEKLAVEKKQRESEERIRHEKELKLALGRTVEENRIILKPPSGMKNKENKIILKLPSDKKNKNTADSEVQIPNLTLNPETATKVANSQHASLREQIIARSFAKARGTMPFPVSGDLMKKYGEASSSKKIGASRARGITINGRSGAQVVAPFDGIVAFAGPFRGYGQLLIIEHSEGYHTLLAGLGRIDCSVGQLVLAGEPVGVMENAGITSLYVELRRNGQPINPLPWLATRREISTG